ncbi:MAG: hypothetical protein WD100_04510 [Tistlia sp.]
MNRAAGGLAAASLALVAASTVLLAQGGITGRQFDLLFAVAAGNMSLALLLRLGFGGLRALAPAIALSAVAIAARLANPDVRLAPYLAVALINGFVAFVFARGVLGGREPLILQVIRLAETGPEGASAFRRFAYGQCWVWAGFGLATALLGVAAMVLPGFRSLAEPAILASLLCQVSWFVASHRYANRRYGRPETWLRTARAFSRPGLWAALDI